MSTLAARTKAEIEAAAEAIRARGDKAEALVLDVTDVGSGARRDRERRAVRHSRQQCRHQPAQPF